MEYIFLDPCISSIGVSTGLQVKGMGFETFRHFVALLNFYIYYGLESQ